MADSITCPHCGKKVEVTEALTHQLQEEIASSLKKKHAEDISEAVKKAQKEIEDHFKGDLDDERERSKKLSHQISELLEEIRTLRRKDEEREIEMKKKLLEEEEKIRKEVTKKAEDEHRLKDFEKDKKLSDALRQVEELKQKIEQGSQQAQGESLELELEEKLTSHFPEDNISEIKKGQRGADVMQVVVDKLGRACGSILWESKNAKWSESWISKLKDDQRSAKADIAILVSVNLPENIDDFDYKSGVWVVGVKHYVSLAMALRYNLVRLHHERTNSQGKDEKMKVMYEYLTGNEFRHRVEAIVESFGAMQDELEREKRWFHTKWARQEKTIRQVIDNTHGMYGDLQGVIGNKILPIKELELLDDGQQNN